MNNEVINSKEKVVRNVKFNANRPYFPFLDGLDIDQDVKRRLSINLANIYSGNSDVYETPIGKEHGSHRILSEWNKVFQENRSSMNEILIELEESQSSKTGPRSISKPWSERKEGIESYFEQTAIDYSTLDASPQALRDIGKLRPLSAAKALTFLKNDTNSGLPFYTRKSKVKERVLARFKYYLDRRDPCILFTRTQEQGKTRTVWGYPVADTLREMMYYRPLLDYQRKLYWRSSLNGPDFTNKRMTYIIQQAILNNLDLISVDFSNYDRSIKRGLQLKVGQYYKFLYQSKYHSEIDEILNRKSTIGLLTPSGVLSGPHGVPSGSTFTNEDDSIAQFIISVKSGVLFRDLYDIQGDDGVYAIHSDKVSSLYNTFKRYKIELNIDKSHRSKDYLIYLQNLYHIDYMKRGVIGGIYPTFRALNRILYQERWSNFEDYDISGRDYYSIRTICILENCKHHPLFKELVKFVLKYDKYGLRPTQHGIRQYIKMITNSTGTEGILVNQYGDDVKGIKSFETVKLIRTLGKA